jgi:hypothetical protein
MKRLITLGATCALALGVTVAPAAAGEKPKPNNVAAKMCQGEKQADKAAFEATYGSKHTMRECKRAHRDEAEGAIENASQECRAERDADAALFAETYGSNKNGKNAFGKCVSQKAREEVDEVVEEFKNAAKECRAEREADSELFAETYGSNKNGKNAFGKCVSQKAHEGDSEGEAPTA